MSSELGPGEEGRGITLRTRALKCQPHEPEFWKLFSPEGSKFRAVLDKAVQADGNVKERYQSHRDTIALLCKPEPELNAAIPSANPAKTMQGSEVRRWNLLWVVLCLWNSVQAAVYSDLPVSSCYFLNSEEWGMRYSFMVEHLLSLLQVLGLIPSTTQSCILTHRHTDTCRHKLGLLCLIYCMIQNY